jgi:predicted nucleic acid-binding Zn ribbon protein
MVRAGRLLNKLNLAPEELALSAWEHAVGKKIAARTRAVSVVRGKLIVQVEDALWQRQLATLEYQILANLERLLGGRVIASLDLRPAPKNAVPRKQPERALARVAAETADHIDDPGLALIYRKAKHKATA